MFLYKVEPSIGDHVPNEYYALEKKGDHFSSYEISESDFNLKKGARIGEVGKKVKSEKSEFANAIRIDLDYGCYIMLESSEESLGDDVEIYIKNKDRKVVFSFDNFNKPLQLANPFIYPRDNIAVNSKNNRVAALMHYFPKQDHSALVLLSIIYDGMINDTRVRLRDSPSLTGKTMKYLNNGDKVKIIDRTNDKMRIDAMEAFWYKVRIANDTEGWVYGTFVTVE
jgi:hypothetical protein